MYTPRAFAETDLAGLDALIAAAPLVSLVTVDADGLPFVSHLPVLYRRDGDAVGVLVWAALPRGISHGHALVVPLDLDRADCGQPARFDTIGGFGRVGLDDV